MTEIGAFWEPETNEPSRDELEWYYGSNGSHATAVPSVRPWVSEPWPVFRDTSDEEIDWLVEGLLPAGAFAFVAAPPKKGKTWLALHASIALATGSLMFDTFTIPNPTPTLYVALEGSRAALRARTGALSRGMGIDPDSPSLQDLHFLYRPRPFDLARPDSGEWLEAEVGALGARFVVIDVLRAAARFRENVAEDFAVVRDAFEPLLREGVTIAVLHHFGKLTETQADRSPGERMAGTGAMYGALDVGLLITKSTDGARRLRVDVDARDFAAPDAIGLVLEGNGTGEHGGFRYTDTARYVIDAGAAMERDLAHELETLLADGKWRTVRELADAKIGGVGANVDEIRALLKSHPDRFREVAGDAVGRSPRAKPWGTVTMSQSLTYGAESVESVNLFTDQDLASLSTDSSPVGGVGVSQYEDDRSTDSDSGVSPANIEF